MNKRRMKIPEAYRAAYAAARKLRWSVTRTGGNHLKWQPPGGRFVITSSSPHGGRHSVANDLDRLRDSGLTW